jgi:predicted NBD/HSP70 family sugar kinase
MTLRPHKRPCRTTSGLDPNRTPCFRSIIDESARVPQLNSPGALLQLIRSGAASTRAELAAVTGLARSTVSQRVDRLLEGGYVAEVGEARSSGGRPPTVLALDADAGVVLVADLGATHGRLAVIDLDGRVLVEESVERAIADGPDVVLPWLVERFESLLVAAGCHDGLVRGIGVGVPGPVEFAAGRAVNPPIMPGWDGVSIPDRLRGRFDVPVLVDNDVNIMALGEYWSHWRGTADDLLFVKVGTGIGSGLVLGGRVHRGAQGAAGDVGHVPLADHRDTVCNCGNLGCVEALASGAALARKLDAAGLPAAGSREVVAHVAAGAPVAVRMVREAGRMLGEVLASMVNTLNPTAIIVGGDIADAEGPLLAGVREVVYRRSTPLATRHLEIHHSRLGDRAGAVGAGVLVLEHVLSATAVDRDLEETERRTVGVGTGQPSPVT